MKMLDDFERGYLAASIDAEGSIMIVAHNRLNKKRFIYYDLYVTVSNTDKKYLLKLKEICGGMIHGYYQQNLNRLWSKYCRWTLGNRSEIYDLLKQVVPCLIIKKRQARLGMKFVRLPKARNQFDPMNDWIHKKQRKMWIQMKFLNRKQKHAFNAKPAKSEKVCDDNSETIRGEVIKTNPVNNGCNDYELAPKGKI